MAQDPYVELGVSRSASADDIRKSFRKLAKQHHPDQNPDNKTSEERFKRVTAAFDILGDAEKRKKFDRGEIDADGRETHPGFRPGSGGGFGGGSPFGGGPFRGGPGQAGGGDFEGVNFEEILGEMFGRGGGPGPGASGMGGAGGGGRRGFAAKGADVRARLDIDLEDAIKGAARRITFGDGKSLDVTIPKGAAEGQVLRLRGRGRRGGGALPATP